jgi:hypothetical protein
MNDVGSKDSTFLLIIEIVIFASLPIGKPLIHLNHDSIEIKIKTSKLINSDLIRVAVGGRKGNAPTSLSLSFGNLKFRDDQLCLFHRFEHNLEEDSLIVEIYFINNLCYTDIVYKNT